MEREANYTAVGAFVILIVAMAGLFVYWYSDSSEHRSYSRYEIYFEGSVSGLAVGSQVRYLGVDVGRVVKIRIDPRAPDRVQVVVDIDSAAPISDRTLAQLSLQGVTGLLFVDLQQNRGGRDVMPMVQSEKFPVIATVKSDFDVFLATLPDLAGRTRELMVRLQETLSPENAAAIGQTLQNIRRASDTLPQTTHDVAELIRDLRSTVADVRSLTSSLQVNSTTLGPNIAQAVEGMRVTAENVSSLTGRLDQMAAENRDDLRAFMQDGLPGLQRTLAETRAAAEQIRSLSRALQEDPSRIIYQPSSRGVEIPR